jgi:hypothetical protein
MVKSIEISAAIQNRRRSSSAARNPTKYRFL